MIIGEKNYFLGNLAMASILLLYYHIIRGGGISNNETVYIDTQFNPYDFLGVFVDETYQTDIDQQLIREEAIICLVCDLNDMISEYEDAYLEQLTAQRVFSAYTNGLLSALPEANELIELVSRGPSFDNGEYNSILGIIYSKYVVATFHKLASDT
ncbi:MAG: hypothetical protein GFH27_549321n15 [Chloroflexi bacterium AL-W]|nr:hypothetical protein [Chloroflexi bacterium AL-N1]NOK64893.1 hypothetical protein [Chloroflexi bacterium AL-N10]NOK76663.1 hypothetical protein [Chloroflexi bacterium AL-N5]NOK84554.1 hypothetical protein [Chloroflexi bacterium AL-W]NOK86621.1 hypothetical protein [Chloroflexi bacterium AL-N15]